MPASFALPFVKRICRGTGSLIACGILTVRLSSLAYDGRAFAQEATGTAIPQPSPSAAEPTAMNVIVQDHFEGEDGLITSHEHCATAEFPFSGTSLPSNPSPIWMLKFRVLMRKK